MVKTAQSLRMYKPVQDIEGVFSLTLQSKHANVRFFDSPVFMQGKAVIFDKIYCTFVPQSRNQKTQSVLNMKIMNCTFLMMERHKRLHLRSLRINCCWESKTERMTTFRKKTRWIDQTDSLSAALVMRLFSRKIWEIWCLEWPKALLWSLRILTNCQTIRCRSVRRMVLRKGHKIFTKYAEILVKKRGGRSCKATFCCINQHERYPDHSRSASNIIQLCLYFQIFEHIRCLKNHRQSILQQVPKEYQESKWNLVMCHLWAMGFRWLAQTPPVHLLAMRRPMPALERGSAKLLVDSDWDNWLFADLRILLDLKCRTEIDPNLFFWF